MQNLFLCLFVFIDYNIGYPRFLDKGICIRYFFGLEALPYLQVGWVGDNPFTGWTVRKKGVRGITSYAAEVHRLLPRPKGAGFITSLFSLS